MNPRLLRIDDWEGLARQAGFQPGNMADLCPISLRQLERFFAERFGETPEQWILKLKCRLAERLIAQGYSTKAVAAELQFASEAHFCRKFRKLHGVPPQSFAPFFGKPAELSFKVNNVV